MEAGLRVVAGPDEVQARVRALAEEISRAYPRGVVLVALLKAGVWLLADLVRHLAEPCPVDFVGVSEYGAEGRARMLKDVDLELTGRDVVLVDALVETGLKARFAIGELQLRGAATVEVCALVDRCSRRIVPVTVRFAGFERPGDDGFDLVGCGLDRLQRHRNLSWLAAADRRPGGLSEPEPDGSPVSFGPGCDTRKEPGAQ